MVLGIQNMSTASGATVLQWDDSGAADQLWRLVTDDGATPFNPWRPSPPRQRRPTLSRPGPEAGPCQAGLGLTRCPPSAPPRDEPRFGLVPGEQAGPVGVEGHVHMGALGQRLPWVELIPQKASDGGTILHVPPQRQPSISITIMLRPHRPRRSPQPRQQTITAVPPLVIQTAYTQTGLQQAKSKKETRSLILQL
ncbi:hypothetical protein QF032_000059 [Streptomyces achromogenes]|nr:hypothetical protein [Streptomyces achromogenes]